VTAEGLGRDSAGRVFVGAGCAGRCGQRESGAVAFIRPASCFAAVRPAPLCWQMGRENDGVDQGFKLASPMAIAVEDWPRLSHRERKSLERAPRP